MAPRRSASSTATVRADFSGGTTSASENRTRCDAARIYGLGHSDQAGTGNVTRPATPRALDSRARTRRYLESESGCLRRSRRGCFVCFFLRGGRITCTVPTPQIACKFPCRYRFRTKRLLRERCSATCQRSEPFSSCVWLRRSAIRDGLEAVARAVTAWASGPCPALAGRRTRR